MKSRLFLLTLSLVVLTACTPVAEESTIPTSALETISTDTVPPAPTSISSPKPTPIREVESFKGLNAAEEPPLTEEELAASVPEFLDEELQTLYRRMHSVYGNLFSGMLEDFDDTWPLAEGQERAEPVEGPTADAPWGCYEVATGRYAAWADFDAMVHSLMTDRLFRKENGNPPLFQEYQGRTAYLPTAKSLGDGNRNPFFPDTFELIEQTEDKIRFYVVGYYSKNADMKDDETYEGWTQRVGGGYEESKKFEIVLLQTEGGWRFDQFTLTEE